MDPPHRVDVITTVNGGVLPSQAVAESGALLGFESGNSRPPEDLAADFIDYPFRDDSATFEDHLEIVRREQPKYAVAPDIDDAADLELTIDQADRLAEHADTVIVVPKGIDPTDVPDRFRVGLPLANWDVRTEEQDPEDFVDDTGQPQFHQWTDYADVGDVHILGGSPTVQLEVAKYDVDVRSVDGSAVFRAAEFGNIWAPTRKRNWHPTHDAEFDFYERITQSLDNIVEAWNGSEDYTTPTDPDDYQAHTNAKREASKLEQERRYREAGTQGAAPYIEPDEADLWNEDEGVPEVIDLEKKISSAEQRAIDALAEDFAQPGLGDLSNRARLVDALEDVEPESWAGVTETTTHPTAGNLSIDVDGQGDVVVNHDSQRSNWTVTHHKAGGADHQRHSDEIDHALELARGAVARLNAGLPAYPKGTDRDRNDSEWREWFDVPEPELDGTIPQQNPIEMAEDNSDPYDPTEEWSTGQKSLTGGKAAGQASFDAGKDTTDPEIESVDEVNEGGLTADTRESTGSDDAGSQGELGTGLGDDLETERARDDLEDDQGGLEAFENSGDPYDPTEEDTTSDDSTGTLLKTGFRKTRIDDLPGIGSQTVSKLPKGVTTVSGVTDYYRPTAPDPHPQITRRNRRAIEEVLTDDQLETLHQAIEEYAGRNDQTVNFENPDGEETDDWVDAFAVTDESPSPEYVGDWERQDDEPHLTYEHDGMRAAVKPTSGGSGSMAVVENLYSTAETPSEKIESYHTDGHEGRAKDTLITWIKGNDPDDALEFLPEFASDRDEKLALFDAEQRGRIMHHAETGDMGSLLRSVGVSTRMGMSDNFADAGIMSISDIVDHHEENGDFEQVDAVGPKTSEKLEAAVPLIEKGLVRARIDDEDDVDDTTGDQGDVDDREALLEVDGIGPTKADTLLDQFDDLRGVSRAASKSTVSIARLDGFSPNTASDLFDKMQDAGVYVGSDAGSVSNQSDSGSSKSSSVSDTDVYDPTLEFQGPTADRPIPTEEMDELPGGVDERRIPDSGISASDYEDWVGEYDQPAIIEDDPEREEFNEAMSDIYDPSQEDGSDELSGAEAAAAWSAEDDPNVPFGNTDDDVSTGRDPKTIEFDTLEEANEAREDFPDAIDSSDNQSSKTVKLRPDLADELVELVRTGGDEPTDSSNDDDPHVDVELSRWGLSTTRTALNRADGENHGHPINADGLTGHFDQALSETDEGETGTVTLTRAEADLAADALADHHAHTPTGTSIMGDNDETRARQEQALTAFEDAGVTGEPWSETPDEPADSSLENENYEPVEFGTLEAANDYRDEKPDVLHGSDNRASKTVRVRPLAADDAGQEALKSRSDESKKYGQKKLTDAERERLEDRSGWKWGTHGFEAMGVKALLTEEGIDDWTSHYDHEIGGADAHKGSHLEQAKLDSGGHNEGKSEEERLADVANQAEKIEGQQCRSARNEAEQGDIGAVEFLLEHCDWSEDDVAELQDTVVGLGEDPDAVLGSIYDPTGDTDDDMGASFEEWAAEMEPTPEQPSDEELAQLAPTPTDDPAEVQELPGPALRALRKAWSGYKHARADQRKAVSEAEKYAGIINGVRAVNGQDPLEFEELEGFQGGEPLPDDPSETYPAPEGQMTMEEAADKGRISGAVQASLGKFGGDVYDPTEEF